MTKEQIAAIESRLQNATPWPWILNGDGECISDWLLVYGADDTTIVGQARDGDDYGGVVSKREDAEIIANAPADIAALLEERRILVALLRKAWGDIGHLIEMVDVPGGELVKNYAQSTIDTIREALGE